MKQRKEWIIRDNKTNTYLGQTGAWHSLPSQCLHPDCFIKRYTHGGMMRYLRTQVDKDMTAITIEHGNKKYGIDFKIDFT